VTRGLHVFIYSTRSACLPTTLFTARHKEVMSQMQEVITTAIFDITHQCRVSFDQVVTQHDEPILTHSFIPNDGLLASNNRSSCDFIGLRNSFLFWIDYTGALSLTDSSLDARLQGLEDIPSMVIELLEMMLRNLKRGEFRTVNPSTN
jgi:hypothetical protein